MTPTDKPIDDERVRYIPVGGMHVNLRAAIDLYGKEQYARGVNDAWPAGRRSGEPVAWGQLGTLNGQLFLRSNYDRTPYPPPPSIVRNLNLIPLYTTPQPRKPLTDQQIWDAVEHGQIGPTMPSKAIAVARAIERAHNIRSAK